MIARMLALLLAAFLLAVAPAAAQNPFTGGPAPTSPASPAPAAAPAEPPGLMAQVSARFAIWQRDLTREMSARLRAIRDGESPFALLIGIALAFLYGAVHAAGPGHGKAVVIGYFLTREARVARGMLMGLQIAVGHVVAAIGVAVVTDQVLKTVWGTSAADLRIVQLVSYGLIVAIGLYMLVQTARGRSHHHHHHDHGHGHDHGHAHEHRPQSLLSLGVAVVPCTGAILVMLFALANGIVLAGVVLVTAIAAGMAVAMAALGMLAILARQAVVGWLGGDEEKSGRIGRVLEYGGAAMIVAIGLILFVAAY